MSSGLRPAAVRLIVALACAAGLVSAGAVRAQGGDWEAVGPLGGSPRDIVIHPSDPQRLYAVAGWAEAGAFRSLDGGETWEPMVEGVDLATYTFARALAQDRQRPERLFLAVGNEFGRLYRSLDGGLTWAPAHVETGQARAVDVDPVDGDRVIFGTSADAFSRGELFLSEDGGETFFEVTPAGLGAVWAVLFDPHDGSYVYCGAAGGLWRSDDSGHTWTDLGSTTRTVSRLSADPFTPGRIYVTTSGTGLWRSDDRGETLVDILGDLPDPGPYSRVAPDRFQPDRLWVGSGDGAFVTEDGGVHWEPRNNGLDSDVRDEVDFINDVETDPHGGRVWAGGDGGLFETSNGGASWEKIGVPAHHANALTAFPGDPSEIAVGTELGLYHPEEDSGYAPGRQCVADSGFQVRSLATSTDGWIFDGYATSFLDAALLRTRDGCREDGTTEGVLFIAGADGVNAVSAAPDGSGVVLAAPGSPFFAGAAIYRSTDGGAPDSFQPVTGTFQFGDVVDFDWDPEDGQRVLALSSGGDVYESNLAGALWSLMKLGTGQRHHRVVFQPDDSLTIYLTYVGGILRSRNGGSTWSQYALDGEDVTALQIAVNDPDVMFASARHTGVLRSEDRGATWQPVAPGPPHLNLVDLLYRPETDRLFGATRGGAVYRLEGAGRIGPDLDLDAVGDASDNCPAVPNPGQANADGDSVGDACDCAPGDANLYRSPSEVTGLLVEQQETSTVLTWDDPRPDAGPATGEDVARGDLGMLRSTGGFDGAECLATGLPAPTFQDGDPDPAAGAGVYYLVRAVNACADGTWGDSTLVPDPRDDLDAAGPCA